MKFFSRELCEKLQKLGCKSEEPSFWWTTYPYPISTDACRKVKEYMGFKAFFQNDFTGCHEQALENAKIVWSDEMLITEDSYTGVSNFSSERWHWCRHSMIDSTDAEEYLKETMAK